MGLAALRHGESSQIRDRPVSPALAGGFLATMPPEKFRISLEVGYMLAISKGMETVQSGHSSKRTQS